MGTRMGTRVVLGWVRVNFWLWLAKSPGGVRGWVRELEMYQNSSLLIVIGHLSYSDVQKKK